VGCRWVLLVYFFCSIAFSKVFVAEVVMERIICTRVFERFLSFPLSGTVQVQMTVSLPFQNSETAVSIGKIVAKRNGCPHLCFCQTGSIYSIQVLANEIVVVPNGPTA